MPSKKKAAKKKGTGHGNFYTRIRREAINRRKPAAQPKRKPPRKSSTDTDTFESGLVFVAMSFEERMDDVFVAIKDACKALRLRAHRIDETVSSGFIILEVIDLIERAEFIIFDLTHERPNVYYELGYAHGVGNSPSNILLLAKHGTDLHFDVAALRVQFYKSTRSLRKIIKDRLLKIMKATRK